MASIVILIRDLSHRCNWPMTTANPTDFQRLWTNLCRVYSIAQYTSRIPNRCRERASPPFPLELGGRSSVG